MTEYEMLKFVWTEYPRIIKFLGGEGEIVSILFV